jgi:hypothetical protein
MARLPLILACLCLVGSACTNAVDPNDPRVGIAEISTRFPGFESDIIYIENGLITLLNGQTGAKRVYQKTMGIGKLDHLRTAGDGRHALYLQFPSTNRSGPLIQLDLVTGNEAMAYSAPIEGFTVYNEGNILISRRVDGCVTIFGCAEWIMFNRFTGNEMNLNAAIEAANAKWGVTIHPPHLSSRSGNDLVIRNRFRDLISDVQKEAVVRFLVRDGQLEPFSLDTLAVDYREFGYTGNYALRRQGQLFQGQLFLDRIDAGTTTMIEKDSTRIRSYSFSTGDEYVVVKKSRTYSKEFYLNDGYHIYKVATGRYFHLFNQSLNMDAFHFSPNKTSVIFLAQFKDESKWHLVTTKIDGTNPVILSTLYTTSEMPRFISVTDDAL